MLMAHLGRGDEGAGALLLAYWALNIPVLGQEIAQVAWQYPAQRNLTLRLLEPLGALEEEGRQGSGDVRPQSQKSDGGITIDLQNVSVRAGGHTLLDDVSLTIPAGAHVAIVGPSGAGKSTLVGLLLGWHRPSTGSLQIDGKALGPEEIESVRRETVWIDPAVQLWNRSVVANLEFGSDDRDAPPIGTRVAEADLRQLLERLPDGLQTTLGEGGGLVSGGEGQRVRFGRGIGRTSVRLAILDESFRGLERERRAMFLRRARERWRRATLLCVTHDIAETAGFERVLVVADGHIVEDGDPAVLAERPGSRYRALIEAEALLRVRLWADPSWRALRLTSGRIVEDCSRDQPVTV
jgi:ATP-binding cassette subfamily B protein